MEGLYWYHDAGGITVLFFYKDGRVISYNRYNWFDQYLHSLPELRVESESVLCFRGIFQIDLWDNIRIVLKGYDLGKMEYRGFIRNEDTIDLFSRCPFTCAKKSATFVRCCERKELIHFEINDGILN